jgi:hypothetical protein
MSTRVSEPCHENGILHSSIPYCFCVKLGDSATTTNGKLKQVFGDDATSRAQAFYWHKMFSEGRSLVEDQQCSEPPSATRMGDNIARLENFFDLIKD